MSLFYREGSGILLIDIKESLESGDSFYFI